MMDSDDQNETRIIDKAEILISLQKEVVSERMLINEDDGYFGPDNITSNLL